MLENIYSNIRLKKGLYMIFKDREEAVPKPILTRIYN